MMTSALAKQVASCNKRSRERGLAGTLTTLDWKRSLDFFEQRCAYCGGTEAWTIDHFEALAYGGGSTHSNCVPSCKPCNSQKASSSIYELPPSFINSERLMKIRTYLEAIGKRNQEHWQRLSEREPAFARMDAAVARLKLHCEEQVQDVPEHALAYASLRCLIFGVEWDPEHYFQVTVSLSWQQRHSTLAKMTAACEDAWRVLLVDAKAISTSERLT